MRRVLVGLIVLGSFAITGTAGALTVQGHHAYVLANRHARCHVDYRKETIRVKGRRMVGCVFYRPAPPVVVTTTSVTQTTNTAPTATPVTPPTPELAVELDPTFSQSPTNPLNVTFSYSASASVNGQPASSLPNGVLEFFSDGQLQCSANVGGSATGGSCLVGYSSFGQHLVNTIYDSGTNSATTGNQIETIERFTPTVTPGTATFGAETVDSDNNYQVQVSIPVTVSGQGTAPTGSISESGWSCTTLIGGTATCNETVENATSGQTSLSPTFSYSGDSNYSSGGGTGSAVVPVAPAPQSINVATTTTCNAGFPAPICTALSNNDNTINGSAQVTANGIVLHDLGTVTFTDASGAVLCVATLTDQASAKCSGPYSGGNIVDTPVTATYSGSSADVGDAYVDNYQVSSGSGSSN